MDRITDRKDLIFIDRSYLILIICFGSNLVYVAVCEFRLSEVFTIRAPNLGKVLQICGIYGARIFVCGAMALGLRRNSQTVVQIATLKFAVTAIYLRFS